MTWFSYGISAVLLILVVFEYRLKYVAKDGRTIEHKRTRRFVLVIAILSILAQRTIEEIKDRRRSNDNAVLRGKVDTANTNIGKLATQTSELLRALGTNNAIDPKLRVEILEHSRAVELVSVGVSDLEQWKTDFKNEEAAAKQKEDLLRFKQQISLEEQAAVQQARIERAWKLTAPFYDFIIRTVQAKVQGVAKERGDKVFSDYSGLPPAPRQGQPIPPVATITTGTNLAWRIEVSAEAFHRRGSASEVYLRVIGTCPGQGYVHWLAVVKTSEIPGDLTTRVGLSVKPNLGPDLKPFNLENYQTDGLAWVQKFIGAVAVQCDAR